jgi:glycolate oxidase FAD binding subunit
MAQVDQRTEIPQTPEEAAEALRTLTKDGGSVRPRGGGTKFSWGGPCDPSAIVSTSGLNDVMEHNAPDMTAVLRAGTPLATAQQIFAEARQMLALDPPLVDDAATIGGIIATNDSGPLRHRYRAGRDLVLGMTVVLGDGTLARSGSRVIKNVAGYDIAKLFAGSLGTLGLIVEMIVRLHPLPTRTVTVMGESDAPSIIQAGALALSHAPLEIESLDADWRDGSGRVLARFGGVAPEGQISTARTHLEKAGLEVSEVEDDSGIWSGQREQQRARQGELSFKVSALPGDFARVADATRRLQGRLVGRAGLGLYWVRVPSSVQLSEVRSALGEVARHIVLQDASENVRADADVWGEPDGGGLRLMQAIKSRFDPANVCAPGVHVGGI